MTKRPLPEIPRPRDVAADVQDLETRLATFALRTRELTAERAAIAAAHASSSVTAVATPRNARVAALLGEADTAPEPSARSRLSEIAIELADLREATEAADRMRQVALTKASAVICAGVVPEYRARVRAVVEALKAAHTATLDLHAFTDALDDREVAWTGMGVAFPSLLGSPKDVNSSLACYLRDLVGQGHITGRDIPSELK